MDDKIKQTFINIIWGLRTGMPRKDVCDYARNALASEHIDIVKEMDGAFKNLGDSPDWYRKMEEWGLESSEFNTESLLTELDI